MTESRYDTSRGNVVALAATIESYGVDAAPLLRQAGIDLEKLDASSRVPGKTMDATHFVTDGSVARLVTESRILHSEVAWRVHGDAWTAWES